MSRSFLLRYEKQRHSVLEASLFNIRVLRAQALGLLHSRSGAKMKQVNRA